MVVLDQEFDNLDIICGGHRLHWSNYQTVGKTNTRQPGDQQLVVRKTQT